MKMSDSLDLSMTSEKQVKLLSTPEIIHKL